MIIRNVYPSKYAASYSFFLRMSLEAFDKFPTVMRTESRPDKIRGIILQANLIPSQT